MPQPYHYLPPPPHDDASTTHTQPCSSPPTARASAMPATSCTSKPSKRMLFNRDHIATAEHERTRLAKEDLSNPGERPLDAAKHVPQLHLPHTPRYQPWPNPRLQRQRAAQRVTSTKHVHFARCAHGPPVSPRPACPTVPAPPMTQELMDTTSARTRSNAQQTYLSCGPPPKRVPGVANGNTCSAKHVTALPFPNLSPAATEPTPSDQFPTSLLSVGGSPMTTLSPFSQRWCLRSSSRDQACSSRAKESPFLLGS
eukprot:CCRYP_019907-RA/>CCRYP_019907-RA protein AED:0.59 eAED:0.21 QI:0/-1/0/1/-1/1/1/0/254